MECPVCFTVGDIHWLDCLHPLCKKCLKRLKRKLCPLCRCHIRKEIYLSLFPPKPTIQSKIRIKTRRSNKRHNKLDIIDIDNRSVFLESFDEVDLHNFNDKKKQKTRSSRIRWTGMNHRNNSKKWGKRNRSGR